MSYSGEQVCRAVDEVLEHAWRDERRRAARHWYWCTLGPSRLGHTGILGPRSGHVCLLRCCLAVDLYLFIAGLTVIAALHEACDPDHLRRD